MLSPFQRTWRCNLALLQAALAGIVANDRGKYLWLGGAIAGLSLDIHPQVTAREL